MEEDPFEGFMQKMKEMAKFKNEVNDVIKAEQEKDEREIMMGLWSALETGTENYKDAFDAIETYNVCIRTIREELSDKAIFNSVGVLICEALSKQIANDALLFKKIDTMVDGMQRSK